MYVEDEGYGIVHLETSTSSKPKLVCASCKTNVHFCEHVRSYKNWSKSQNIDIDSELEYQRDLSPDESHFSPAMSPLSPAPGEPGIQMTGALRKLAHVIYGEFFQ